METTSPKNTLNWIDAVNLLKNIGIFFIPSIITILTAFQNGQEITQAFIMGALVSTLIKILEYYNRKN